MSATLSAGIQGNEALSSSLQTVINAAILAPSGDNTQPWRFIVDGNASTISVEVDAQRDMSPMNAGQRMSRIAVGAAVENMLLASQHNGWAADLVGQTNSQSTVKLQGSKLTEPGGEVPELLLRRVTNRRLFAGSAIEPKEIRTIENGLSSPPGIRVVLITDRGALTSVASAIGRADALMFGVGSVRRAFLKNVRLDRPPLEPVEEGLSVGSLELGWGERFGLRLLGAIPDGLFRLSGMANAMQAKARSLVGSAGGMCVILCDQSDPLSDFKVGRQMQRTWLRLTALNYAVQPMMSLPVLGNLVQHDPAGAARSVANATAELSSTLLPILDSTSSERIAAILRFGKAPPPTGRTGRRDASSITQIRANRPA